MEWRKLVLTTIIFILIGSVVSTATSNEEHDKECTTISQFNNLTGYDLIISFLRTVVNKITKSPETVIDEIYFGFGSLYVESTATPGIHYNYISCFPQKRGTFNHWNFDGTFKPGTFKPFANLEGFPKPGRVEGPQDGYSIFFKPKPNGCNPKNLQLEGLVGMVVFWNYTENVPEIYPVDPSRISLTRYSLKPVLRWELTEPYEGEDMYIVNYTVRIWVGAEETKYYTEDKFLDLGTKDLALKYDTAIKWEVMGRVDDLTTIALPQKPYPWSFRTVKDEHSPNIPSIIHPDNGNIFNLRKPVLTWFGGDRDDIDFVRYHIFINDSTNLDNCSIIKNQTDYYNGQPDNVPISVILNDSDVGKLLPNEKYYWKIVAEDWGNLTCECEISYFITKEN